MFSRDPKTKGPIFYNATRIGQNRQPFTMYKFRTMQVNAPDLLKADGSTLNSPNDERLTAVGKWLRNTSLDELPQVLNVLKGQMSIIGPRPNLPREVEQYEPGDEVKLQVKPGITGYAQVNGRNTLHWREQFKLDVYYVQHRSLWLDIKIFLRSFAVVFRQEGIYIE